jgi:hypothetical protein
MGNAGFHSGAVLGERVKAGVNYLNDREYIAYQDFETTNISGTAATANNIGGSPRLGALRSYSFTLEGLRQLAFSFVAPMSLKRKTKANLRLLWAVSGVAGQVVWNATYLPISMITSGTRVTGEAYNISGSHLGSRATATGTIQCTSPAAVSGVIQNTVLEIPAGDIKAGDIVKVSLWRDPNEPSDTFVGPAHLIGVLVEYTDG